jgi:hypothetical protein
METGFHSLQPGLIALGTNSTSLLERIELVFSFLGCLQRNFPWGRTDSEGISNGNDDVDEFCSQ